MRLFSLTFGFIVLALIVYGASLQNGFILLDDPLLVQQNPVIRELTPRSIGQVFTMYDPELYIPLAFLTYQIAYQIGGLHPMIFHALNLIIHIGNALLVLWLLSLLFASKPETRNYKPVTIFLGAIFLLHPLHTEAVSWIAALKDVLSAHFFLWAWVMHLRFRQTEKRMYRRASIEFFVLACLSKVTAITLPVIVLISDWHLASENVTTSSPGTAGRTPAPGVSTFSSTRERLFETRWAGKVLQEFLPYFLIALIFAVIALFGKDSGALSEHVMMLTVLSGKAALLFIGKFLMPLHFSIFYPLDRTLTILSPSVILPFIALLIATAIIWIFRRHRLLFLGWSVFLITLAPSLLNAAKMREYFFASDRYAYLPSIGLLIIIGYGLTNLRSLLSMTGTRRRKR